MAQQEILKIQRKCFAIERAFSQGVCGQRELRAIDALIVNAARISDQLSPETASELRDSLVGIRDRLLGSGGDAPVALSVSRVRTGGRGRPAIDISREQIEFFLRQGHTVKQIAGMFGCSSSFLYKKTKLLGVSARRHLQVTDEELTQQIARLCALYPNIGSEMMRGLLRAEGLLVPRRRVCDALTQINLAAAAHRCSSAVTRRVHHAPHPNSVWHIDLNMRLIRWSMVIHGAIDGNSRLITYLICNSNNRASTILTQFVKATCLYGLPSRIRSDYGGENSQVALFMNLAQGVGRRSHITDKSAHNQRIERLWRDVFLLVLHSFYDTFYTLENSEHLDPMNDVHKLSLKMVFLPEIQKRLDSFRDSWNNHSLRTENSRTPIQIWISGMLANTRMDSTAINNVFGEDPYKGQSLEALLAHHGIETFPSLDEDDHFPAVVVNEPRIYLTPQQQQLVALAIEDIPDITQKYQTCCTEIANMFVQPRSD